MIIIIILQSLFGILPERHSFLERLKKKKKRQQHKIFKKVWVKETSEFRI